MKFAILLTATAVLGSGVGCFGQQKTITPTFPGLRLPGTGNTIPQGSSTGVNSNNGPLQRGIYLTGRVQLDDGGPISSEVRIEKVCSGRRQPLGYADSKGRFSVTMKTDQAAATSEADYDTSSSRLGSSANNSSSLVLSGCDIQAALGGYRSDTINLGSMRSLDDPNVGTIVLHRLGGMQGGGVVSASMLSAPKSALKNYQRGLEDLHKEDAAGAEKNFQKAVTEYPEFASAWFQLGLLTRADEARSRTNFEKAITADPKFMPPYAELGSMLDRQKQWRDAADVTERALRLDSAGFPEIFYYSAVAHFNLGQLEEAEKRGREAVKADDTHKLLRAPLLLGYILAAKGQNQEAAEQMRAFLALNPDANDAARTRLEIAQLEARASAKNP